jgi:hypothetical protein
MYYPLFATKCFLFLRPEYLEHSLSGPEPGRDVVEYRNCCAKKQNRPFGVDALTLLLEMN